jgi:hypothetical protein
MADIIQFPRAFSVQNDEPPQSFPVTPAFADRQELDLTNLSFTAAISLRGGKDVVCSIGYPHGKIAKKLVAIMLRQAAKMIENEPNKR